MADPAPNALARVVELAMQRVGAKNARQLSDQLGMDDIDRERRVRRWITGQNAPSFDYMMLMLSKAGLLTEEADRAWRGEVVDPAAEARAAAADAKKALDRGRGSAREESARRAREN